MIYAIYRALYGEDYIETSIASIRDYVDKVFVFWTDIPLGRVTSVNYEGQHIEFPVPIDNFRDIVDELAFKDPGIIPLYDHVDDNINQFTHLVNDRVLPLYGKPDQVLFIEHDMVFRKDQLESAIEEFIFSGYQSASTSQIEIWKLNPCYRIPLRSRPSCVFWNMKDIDQIPHTGRHANAPDMKFLESYNHNFGFCMTPTNMYWKHLLAIAFSPVIGDGRPNVSWYNKWLDWRPDFLNENLEISQGREHLIPKAVPYDRGSLPEEILKRHSDKIGV